MMGNSYWDCRSFVWEDGQTSVIGPVGNTNSAVGVAISQDGQVAGFGMWETKDGLFHREAFLWEKGALTQIPQLSGYTESVTADCNDSIVVGLAYEGVADPTTFIWSNGQIRRLSDLIPIPGFWPFQAGPIAQDGRIAVAGMVAQQSRGYVLTPIYAPPGECTGDCFVNVPDLLHVISEWNKTESSADVNHDGIVNAHDILVVIGNWTP
jgi:uncharacterized membrane protein